MSLDQLPTKPTALAPADNAEISKTVARVTLSWAAVEGPGAYSLRCVDLTEPSVRHAANNCAENKHYLCLNNLTKTSFDLEVRPGHRYQWWVHKVNPAGWSEPAVMSFAVGAADAAEVVAQIVPEVIAPGIRTQVSVTVRNTGTTTWNAQSGYQLGSSHPVDNKRWGASRIAMDSAAAVHPGGSYTFKWLITAPANPGLYNFQWRMVHNTTWFGATTHNRVISVKRRDTGGNWATRNLANGLLMSAAGKQIVIRGGHYHLFEKNSQAQRQLEYADGRGIISENYGACLYPCPPDTALGDDALSASKLVNWTGEPWSDLFTILQNRINVLRVFLFNGFPIKDGELFEDADELYPFELKFMVMAIPAPIPGKPPPKPPKVKFCWKMQDAIENDRWNDAYFARLRSFAEKARDNNVFLQISLFNYFELNWDENDPNPYDSPWPQSFWNPVRSLMSPWAKENLVSPSESGQGNRQLYFIKPEKSGLRRTQETIVRKVVKELQGLPNIILEVMNEPHWGTHEEVSRFSSAVVGWIIDEAAKYPPAWRPLISVNASRPDLTLTGGCPDANEYDVDWWAQSTEVENYQEVDIISYHGLTGYKPSKLTITCVCQSPKRAKKTFSSSFPPVGLRNISDRYECFRTKHPGKALMLSTDAVSVANFNHVYGKHDMNLRDGQIITGLGNADGSDADKQTQSDLGNWAYWCFSVANAAGGVIHFQNHSTFAASYALINGAFAAAGRR